MELIQGRTFPPYLKTVRKLKKKYPNVEADLEKLFSEIAKDPQKSLEACHRARHRWSRPDVSLCEP